jgi:hypothetical protein
MIKEKSAGNNWKEGLEDADNLPGYVLQNKQAAWEKMHARLHEKKTGNKLNRYWVAAACLLIALSLMLIKAGKKNNLVIVHTTATSQPEKVVEKPEPLIIKTAETNNNSVSPVKRQRIVTSKKKELKNSVTKIEEKTNDSALQPAVIMPATQAVSAIIKDSAGQSVTAILPLQKKMKVMHINELDNNGNINMVHTQKRLPARIKFLNQDIYTDYTVMPSHTGFNILKLHSTPSN